MNRHSQQGLTTIGWILIIGIFGLLVVTGFTILPMYLDYFKIKSVMDTMVEDESIDANSKRDLLKAVNRRLQINQVRNIGKEAFTFTREKDMTIITVDYEVREPYLAELFIGAHFTYTVEIKR